MNRELLARLEALNQIHLDEAQKDDVLAFFAKREAELVSLNQIDTSQTDALVHIASDTIALREDVVIESFSRQKLQAQSPQTDAGYFCVPRVIE